MSTTKINITPVENKYIRLILSLENMDKEKLEDLGDSFLVKINKKSKSGNELYFSIFFNKKLMNKPVKSSNPSVSITKNKNLIALEVTMMLELTEIQKAGEFYLVNKEYATTPAFEFSYKMNQAYYDKKIGQYLESERVEEDTEEKENIDL
ncbi:hypothetical protein [Niallia nealsonii]|uniref:Uncharacterized protein n=1 Tax=Niallia nealsonii TaxID=115979 RepID=A0A2N0Z2P0_9BACI|nr:hypothetical protein [Niallia nealsonii]PKG23776.1 hypothetical protein CWS01_09740 [Niallia nealsonii]